MEDVVEFNYRPPGPRRGQVVEVVTINTMPNRKVPKLFIGKRGTVVKANFGPDGNRWIRVDFAECGRIDFLACELRVLGSLLG